MQTLLWLVLTVGVAPLAVAVALLPAAGSPRPTARAIAGSSLLCALAFNLTFFWQELWLVLSKAMVPGLNPVLHHNDHDWTGDSALAELLQGVGAIATLGSGLMFLLILTQGRSGAWRLFVAWMAFQGLFQSMSQVAIGSLLSGNDVGRAFSYLGLSFGVKVVALACAILGMAAAGYWLARLWPTLAGGSDKGQGRGRIAEILLPAALSVIVLIPFRLPRELIEVVLVPAVVNLLGVGWVALGFAGNRRHARPAPPAQVPIARPAAALLVVLAVFQLVLAPGIAF